MTRPQTIDDRAPARAGGVLAGLAAELGEEGLIGAPVRATPLGDEPLAALLAEGPRTRDRAELYGRVIECVREGYLLHYGAEDEPRLLEPCDPDLALLAGDYLYAKGIALLASAGDLEAVEILADLISFSADLHARLGSGWEAEGGAMWAASAVAIATGIEDGESYPAARMREEADPHALYDWAAERAATAGLSDRLVEVAETVGFRP